MSFLEKVAEELGVEKGKKVRLDSTDVESNDSVDLLPTST
jgi:hypothetical protein